MLERRVSLLCLLLGSFTCLCLITSVSALGSLASKRSSVIDVRPNYPDSVRIWPADLHPSVVTEIRVAGGRLGDVGDDTTLPVATPTYKSNAATTIRCPADPTVTGRASMLGRRTLVDGNNNSNNNNNALVISSLNSALASATASALSMSHSMAEEFASSLGELQASAGFLASSASSALAAASGAVLAAEESAAQAIFAVEKSASSVVAEATCLTTGVLPDTTTTRVRYAYVNMSILSLTKPQTQAQLELEAAEGAAMSITRASVAIVVSIIVSALCSIMGFYLFLRYRRARKKRQREEGREDGRGGKGVPKTNDRLDEHHEHPAREQEGDLSATEALARAVVSYIEKEQMPTPVTPVLMGGPVHPASRLSPQPRHPPTPLTPLTPTTSATPARNADIQSPARPVSPGKLLLPTRYEMPKPEEKNPTPKAFGPRESQCENIGFAVGGEVDDPLWVQQHPPPNHPPPPTPLRPPSGHHRKTSSASSARSNQTLRRTPSNPRQVPQPLPRQTQQVQQEARPQDSVRNIYGEIITHPLETVTTNESSISRRLGVDADAADRQPPRERDERRDSNWPLPKAGWL